MSTGKKSMSFNFVAMAQSEMIEQTIVSASAQKTLARYK